MPNFSYANFEDHPQPSIMGACEKGGSMPYRYVCFCFDCLSGFSSGADLRSKARSTLTLSIVGASFVGDRGGIPQHGAGLSECE